jgi:hypothetical protein
MHLSVPNRDRLPAGLVPEPLEIYKVLYEAESPVVYVTKTLQGQLLLAYVSDDTQDGVFTLLAPMTPVSITSVERCSIPLRDALTASWLWLHISGGNTNGLWSVDVSNIPSDCLPLAGTLVHPGIEPVFRARAIGQQVVLGRIPASVVSFIADGMRQAMKTLLDYTFAIPLEGRPRQEHRALYDLPVQRFAFSSFELSFGAPDDPSMPQSEIRDVALKLERGLKWASDNNSSALDGISGDERDAILRAALCLTPPAAGPIQEVQVSGGWIPSGRVRLTRDSRKRIRQELKRVESERIVRLEGRIGELDIDNLSFTLRDVGDGQDRRGYFTDDLLDDMVALLSDVGRVAVAGTERHGRLMVSAVGPVDSADLNETPTTLE